MKKVLSKPFLAKIKDNTIKSRKIQEVRISIYLIKPIKIQFKQ